MKSAPILAPLLLLGATQVPAEDAAVLRATLAEVENGGSYCVTAALGDAPFAGYQRDVSESVEGAERQPNPGERVASLRERVMHGWITPSGKPLARATEKRIVAVALVLAERGDPTPLPAEVVGDLNVMDAADVPPEPIAPELEAQLATLEAQADKVMAQASVTPADHGRIERAWLVSGQQLGEECPNPALSLSAVAREGDLAFVDVGRVWAPLAGVGETWVMQRTSAGWRRIARRRSWIS